MPDPIKAPSLLPLPSGGNVRPMFRSLGISGSGLSVQRQRMETIAQNIANADVTRGADGQPYKRRDVIAETATSQNAMFGQQGAGVGAAGGSGAFSTTNLTKRDGSVDGIQSIEVPFLPLGSSLSGTGPDVGEYGVRVAGIAEDQGEGRLVYEPGHPDANESGYVRYPDIDTTQELVKLMDAKRIYEANAAVFQTTKSILRAALDI